MTLKFDHHLSEAQELNVKVGFVEGSAASVNRCSLAKCEYVLLSVLLFDCELNVFGLWTHFDKHLRM